MSFAKLTLQVVTADGHNCVLFEPLEFTTKAGRVLRMIMGATTDGASMPRALWRELPPFGTYWLAAVLHDGAYRDQLEERQVDGSWKHVSLSKSECDQLLNEAMESLGVNEIARITIYEGVHFGGQSSFDEDRKAVALDLATHPG